MDQEVALRPDGKLLGVVVHSGLVLGRSKDVVAPFDGSRHSPEGWPWTPSSWLATSMPKPQADESTQQRPTDGLRRQPNGRPKPQPSTTARPQPSGEAPQRPNGITRGRQR